MADNKMNDRRMMYPYTLTAKIVQFPYKYYWNNSWGFKYSVIGVILCFPIFWKVQRLSYAPANVAAYEKQREKDHLEHEKHLQHLL